MTMIRPAVLAVLLLAGAGLGLVFAQSNARPRMAPLSDRELTDRQRAIIASYVRGGVATNDIRTLLNHPASMAGVMPFWNYNAFE
jgi:hypothetical protein